MSLRDELRKATVGAKKEFRSKLVTINGKEVEVRQPTVKGRREIVAKSTVDGEIDSFEFGLWCAIKCTYVPGTNDRLYEDGDYEGLSEQPAGSFVDELANEASALMVPEGN